MEVRVLVITKHLLKNIGNGIFYIASSHLIVAIVVHLIHVFTCLLIPSNWTVNYIYNLIFSNNF